MAADETLVAEARAVPGGKIMADTEAWQALRDQVANDLQDQLEAWLEPIYEGTDLERRGLLRMILPPAFHAVGMGDFAANEVLVTAWRALPTMWCVLPAPACTGTLDPETGDNFHDGATCPRCEDTESPYYEGGD